MTLEGEESMQDSKLIQTGSAGLSRSARRGRSGGAFPGKASRLGKRAGVALYDGDVALLGMRAEALGLCASELGRRLVYSYLCSPSYLGPVNVLLLCKHCDRLKELTDAFSGNLDGIPKLIEAGVVSDCVTEVSENNQQLARTTSANLVLIGRIIDQAEERAASAKEAA